ncbi:MAG: NAD(P)/FAD-dependent oxidoreductase [Candidatus Pacebacteria bacterium]|nr:NAD(P)/FAD-dependent oxidoreductase [Candidatus Paceibacterota bacterium]MCD8527804.1 NAD(P)/FAD-dependent oxidoreductase [Candidatus Paceibacterota bacterium]MCD8563631.1 NAD(P)/FAD-dependent oxidoreductase [Candidatus Paceibacterota bacterium]
MNTHIIIVGGGFAGVRTALDLAHRFRHTDTIEITLISNYPFFEYYPAMYRVVTGSSPMRVQIPLGDIFEHTRVRLVHDTVERIDTATKTVICEGGETYVGDMLVLALGSEMNYFNIEGLEQVSFNFKSVHKALELKKHIHQLFERARPEEVDETLVALNFLVVGAGPSGVELAGELALYARALAQKHNIPESFISINLIQASSRILPTFPEEVSARATQRLRMLGVNVLPNRTLIQGKSWTALLKDMNMGTRTIIWTAGVKTNNVFQSLVDHFEFDGKGRVIVDEYLQAKGHEHIFIAGDNAATPFSGLAQTALYDGAYIARSIEAHVLGKKKTLYTPRPVAFDVPVGPGWAALVIGNRTFYGRLPWLVRHIIDFKFYLSILSLPKAWRAFFARNEII